MSYFGDISGIYPSRLCSSEVLTVTRFIFGCHTTYKFADTLPYPGSFMVFFFDVFAIKMAASLTLLVLSCLVFTCLAVSCLALPYIVFSCLVSCMLCFVLSCLVFSFLFSYLLFSSLLISSHLFFSLLFSSHLFSSLLFSALLFSSLLISSLLFSSSSHLISFLLFSSLLFSSLLFFSLLFSSYLFSCHLFSSLLSSPLLFCSLLSSLLFSCMRCVNIQTSKRQLRINWSTKNTVPWLYFWSNIFRENLLLSYKTFTQYVSATLILKAAGPTSESAVIFNTLKHAQFFFFVKAFAVETNYIICNSKLNYLRFGTCDYNDPGSWTVWGVALRLLVCWGCGIESRRRRGVCLLWLTCVVR